MKLLTIYLSDYKDMIINEKGQVLKVIGNGRTFDIVENAKNYNETLDEHLNKWRITGTWKNSGGYIKEYCNIGDLFKLAEKGHNEQMEILKYKNGKYILGLCDVDHGTARYDMTTKIVGLKLEKEID